LVIEINPSRTSWDNLGQGSMGQVGPGLDLAQPSPFSTRHQSIPGGSSSFLIFGSERHQRARGLERA